MELYWHPYRYYPYERDLALREISALLSPDCVTEVKYGIRLEGKFNTQSLERLVYYAEASDGDNVQPTLQSKLERINGNGHNRQSTRYSVHGLHEYKGKFNPQIARAILNILNVPLGARILDPFCGSGTSLVECSHLGMRATGIDLNPLAIFIANAKLSALKLRVADLRMELNSVIRRHKSMKRPHTHEDDDRMIYLKNWFEPMVVDEIERLRRAIVRSDSNCASVLLSIASNLLRDYSLQDPHDLRIRRRKSPLPDTLFIDKFKEATDFFLTRLEDAQDALGKTPTCGKAFLLDSRSVKLGHGGLGTARFNCALTSPPYATALPYIDTQRLSLVWLGLLLPSDILHVDAILVGSREVRGKSKKELLAILLENRNKLPKAQVEYCRMLQDALSDDDGFRRQAVPMLLYRYFSDMAEVFRSVRGCMNVGAPFALIVGSNHTILGGQRFDIDTPEHLAQIARYCGWICEETVPLQTYQRYGYHMNNAISSERLVILRSA